MTPTEAFKLALGQARDALYREREWHARARRYRNWPWHLLHKQGVEDGILEGLDKAFEIVLELEKRDPAEALAYADERSKAIKAWLEGRRNSN
jgi:hypothetical protein